MTEMKMLLRKFYELAMLPLGNHIRRLYLALRDTESPCVALQDYDLIAASILEQSPCLQSLYIFAGLGSRGNNPDLPLESCWALSSLKDLRVLQLRGLSIPANCPMLRNVEHIQTDAEIHTFKCLPKLKDLHQNPDMFPSGYNIPSRVLTRLEVLHYCTPDDIEQRALLPQVCRVRIQSLIVIIQAPMTLFEMLRYDEHTIKTTFDSTRISV